MTDLATQDAPAATSATGPNPTGDFIWYELMTPDPMGAKAFYDAVVGWNVGEPAPAGSVEYRMIGRTDGGNAGGVLTLTDDMAQHGAKPIWLGYVHVDDVDASANSIKAAGGSVQMAPSDIPGVGRIAMVADPQGAPFYIMKPIPPADQPNAKSDVFSETEVQRCGWNELSTSDTDASRRFYGEQFGWNSDDFMPMGEMGEYRFFFQNGTRIGAVFNPGPDQHARWRFYFRVPSIAAAKDAVEKGGGKVAVGPMEVPGGDNIIVGFDPQGAEFALVGKA
jgi:predicted enzyme related to lactoylglutathione lyase